MRQDRRDGYGGVLLGIKNDLIYEKLETRDDVEAVFTKISLDKNKNLIVSSVYRPPNSDHSYTEDLCSTIEDLEKIFKNAVFWSGVDFNLPDINWQSSTVEGHQNSTRINNMLLDLAETLTVKHCSVYRPPNSDHSYTEDLCSTIEDLEKIFKNAVFWSGVDFNLPDINWQSSTVEGHQNSTRINNMLLDLAETCDMQQMV